MRIIFAGTPDFSVPCLNTLIQAKHDVIGVYTQPDRPAGRGRKLSASPVKSAAVEHNIPVYQPLSLKTVEAQQQLADLAPDLMVVIAYGLILPQAVLTIPKYGCVNIHASILPRWRGAAPIQRAIIAGDAKTGVTIMQMDAGLDTGDMLAKVECDIVVDETSQSLHDKLATLGNDALLNVIDMISSADSKGQVQNDELSCYAAKLTKEEACINWQQEAVEIERQIRGYNPWPVAYTTINEQRLKVYKAQVVDDVESAKLGSIVTLDKEGIVVSCGKGCLRIEELQLSGGKRLSAQVVLNAKAALFAIGQCFE